MSNNKNNKGRKFLKKKKKNNNNNVPEGTIDLFQKKRSPFPPSMMRANPFPPACICDMVYHSHANTLNSGVASFASVEFKVNDGFDPEAVGGGTQPAGWIKMGAIYNTARIESVSCEIQFVNYETDNALIVGWILADEQPSPILTTVDRIKDALEVSPSSGPLLLGTRDGQNKLVFRHPFIKLGDVVGNRLQYDADVSYSQAINGSPSQIVWGLLVVYSSDDTITIPLGITYDIKLVMRTRFFSLRSDQDL